MLDSEKAALDGLTVPLLTMPVPATEQPGFLSAFANWHVFLDVNGALWAILDCRDKSTNTLSEPVLRELDVILDEAGRSPPKALVIRSAKRNGFIAGAEIRDFEAMTDEATIKGRIEQGLVVLDHLETFKAPTIALIHGFCLGGGLELALACKTRIATPEAKFGFPEVMLGLHPGLGGVWRSLRHMNAVDAMTAMLTGKTLIARKAKQQGLIDVVTEERHFAEALRWALGGRLAASPGPGLKGRILQSGPVRGLLAGRMEKETAKKARRDHYPAPYALIDLWRRHGDDPLALRRGETESFARLMLTDTSRNLVRCFFLREKLKGYAKGLEHRVRHVHVIGAGVMGGDIAAWAALRGFRVTLEDRELKYIAPAIGRAARLFQSKLYTEGDRRAAQDRLMPDPKGYGIARADLILEAVPENAEIKHAVYARCEERMKDGAILATNTSSILLQALTGELKRPERFCGIHFFNPVAQMPLVELVTHDGLDPSVQSRALAFIEALDKLPLPVRSAPGFLVNRALTPYMMEAFVLRAEGVKPETIDAAAEDFGMPMGPIELADRVGLDVGLHVAKVLKRDLPSRPLPDIPDWFETLVGEGKLGHKSGHGVYVWREGGPVKARRPRASDPRLQDRLILPLLNAVADCLHEGIVQDPDAADAGMVFGTGFAPFRGGPIHYARARGVAEIVALLEQLRARYGDRFAPSPGWEALR